MEGKVHCQGGPEHLWFVEETGVGKGESVLGCKALICQV